MKTALFDRLAASELLSPLDIQLARMLLRLAHAPNATADLEPETDDAREAGESAEWVAISAALVSRQRARGHSCIDLGAWAGRPLPGLEPAALLPTVERWRALLSASPLVAVEGTAEGSGEGTAEGSGEGTAEGSGEGTAEGSGEDTVDTDRAAAPLPLVLDSENRLFLWRYRRAEERLAERVWALLDSPRREDVHDPAIARFFQELFPPSPDAGEEPDWQAVAAVAALRSPLCLVSGGPGTGKTTTVTRILALLAAADPGRRFALAAPTGKAAARLEESIGAQLARSRLPDELIALLPRSASTLHRLLAYSPSTDRFGHHRDHPLRCDVLVIDEASMVDLLMMDAVLDALPPSARLILLGDRDQLASVDTGFVFGDLCTAAGIGAGDSHSRDSTGGAEPAPSISPSLLGSHAFFAGLTTAPPSATPVALDDAAVELRISYRFRSQPGIGKLATAIRRRDPGAALSVLDDPEFPDVERRDPPERPKDLLAPIAPLLARALAPTTPEEGVAALERFRILTAMRQGPFGVERLNQRVEELLDEMGHEVSQRFYRGQPLLITANDYRVRLFNGDLGIVWPDAGSLWAFFPDTSPASSDGSGATGLRRLPLGKLPAHETAWAMTVHKSQGSELDRVLLILPETEGGSDLVSRELLYTGVTRARERVGLVATPKAVTKAVLRTSQRASGLVDALRRGRDSARA